jgi:hypothetical protein
MGYLVVALICWLTAAAACRVSEQSDRHEPSQLDALEPKQLYWRALNGNTY